MIRVFQFPSIFMQRLAWLRAAAYFGTTRARSSQELASAIFRLASAPMTPTPAEGLILQDYAKVRQATGRIAHEGVVPAQDLWLSRSQVSWNGSLTRDSAAEIPDWAVSMGVTKPRSFTTTALGRR